MEAKSRRLIESILKHKTLSHADFRKVDVLGDDGFDYIKDVLPRAPMVQHKINGLGLLMRVGIRISERHGTIRLSEVFDVAADLLGDPDPDVRTAATRMIVGVLGLLKSLEKSLDIVGGSRRVWDTLQRALQVGPKKVERRLVEEALAKIEPMLTA